MNRGRALTFHAAAVAKGMAAARSGMVSALLAELADVPAAARASRQRAADVVTTARLKAQWLAKQR